MFKAERFAEADVSETSDLGRVVNREFKDYKTDQLTGRERVRTSVKILHTEDPDPQWDIESLSLEFNGQPPEQRNPLWFTDLGHELIQTSHSLRGAHNAWVNYYDSMWNNLARLENDPAVNETLKAKKQAVNESLEGITFNDPHTADIALTSIRISAAMQVARDKFKTGDAKRKDINYGNGEFDPANRTPILNRAIENNNWEQVPEVFKNEYYYPLLDGELTLTEK